MNTLGETTAKAVMQKHADQLVNESFVCTALVKPGENVKLNSDGTVSPIALVTDIPIGTVVVGNKATTDLVTVQTVFRAIVIGVSDAGSTCGARVAASGSASNVAKYKTAVTTNLVIGQALETKTDTNEIKVGLYFNPYLLTIA